jgi:hypothetical protein
MSWTRGDDEDVEVKVENEVSIDDADDFLEGKECRPEIDVVAERVGDLVVGLRGDAIITVLDARLRRRGNKHGARQAKCWCFLVAQQSMY